MIQTHVLSEIVDVLKLEAQAILECADRLEKNSKIRETYFKAVEMLHQCLEMGGTIVVTGVGKSGKIGQKMAATFCSTGSLSLFLHAAEALHGDIGVIRPGDVILALSYTGNTEELLSLFPSFNARRVPVIGIGGNRESKLAALCDVWMDASVDVEACPNNLAPTSSTTLALAIGDALAVTLMKRKGFDSTAFAQNHPGGSLGKRLNLKVQDLMHTREQVAVAGPTASMDEIVVVSTEKKLGAVLIVEQNKLLGIITDGDLRRSLQHREKFFQLTARDVMTPDPIRVVSSVSAQTALELMENRSSQISVLPVVSENGAWMGLIRLHDIVRTF